MESIAVSDCQVEIEKGRVVVNMHPTEERRIEHSDFESVPVATRAVVTGVTFYTATNRSGEIERCVSSTIEDRKAVAALVAGWIAEGLVVQSCSARELRKHLVSLEKIEKEAAAAAKAHKESVAALSASLGNGGALPEQYAEQGAEEHALATTEAEGAV